MVSNTVGRVDTCGDGEGGNNPSQVTNAEVIFCRVILPQSVQSFAGLGRLK